MHFVVTRCAAMPSVGGASCPVPRCTCAAQVVLRIRLAPSPVLMPTHRPRTTCAVDEVQLSGSCLAQRYKPEFLSGEVAREHVHHTHVQVCMSKFERAPPESFKSNSLKMKERSASSALCFGMAKDTELSSTWVLANEAVEG